MTAYTPAPNCADCGTYHPAAMGCPAFRICGCHTEIYFSANGSAWYHRATNRQPCNGVGGPPFAQPSDVKRPKLPPAYEIAGATAQRAKHLKRAADECGR